MQAKADTGDTKSDKADTVNRYNKHRFNLRHFRSVHNNRVINNNV
jgi:hypothetical protein